MGKELKIIIKDKFTIILDEDAKKGDYIDLSKIQDFDNSRVLESIENGSNKVFNEKLNQKENELKRIYEAEITSKLSEKELEIKKEYDEKISSYKKELAVGNATYNALKDSIPSKLNEEKTKIKDEYEKVVSSYKEELLKKEASYNILKESISNKLNEEKLELEKTYNEIIANLRLELANKENESKSFNEKLDNELLKQKVALNEIHQEELTKKDEEIAQINDNLSKLKFEKSLKSTKEVGEDLEKWCNDEYQKYSLAFTDCKFYKDSIVVKDEDGTNGTKADYIFKVYSTESKNEEDLLSSVCLEMKNESVDNISSKKKNSDHYAKLDKDREKKNCEYALLVSTLEWDNENDAVIRKVDEYKNMYVVRPQYFIPFLAMLRSLSNKYKNILNGIKKEELSLKDKEKILEDFEDLKETYIRKPISIITSRVNEINKQAGIVEESASKIRKQANEIVEKYVDEINKKLETYDVKMKTLTNKVDKINKEE